MRSLKKLFKGLIGKLVYIILKTIKTKNTVIIYAGPLLGDALYSMAFIEEYKKANPRKKIVVWTSPKLFDTIATFHGYDKIKVIRSKVMRGLVWQIWNSDPRLHSRAVECGLLNQFAFRDLDPFASEMTLLKERIFQVGEAASISFHHVKPQTVTAIPDFYENKNKIVVLNPYSNTTHLSDGIMESFGRLAEYIKQRGGVVYTNVIADQKPIYGTAELRCSLAELLEIAKCVPFVVSVRSGMLDFIVQTGANMFILYGAEKINIQAYGLQAWDCGGVIRELTFTEFLQDTDFEKFGEFCQRLL